MRVDQQQGVAPLSDGQVAQFIRDGFVRMNGAFSRDVADAARTILWRDLPCDQNDPSTWTRSVIWLEEYDDEPFSTVLADSGLCAAQDQLVGRHRWRPRQKLARFPIRFPHSDDPGDNWHIDVSFPGEDNWNKESRDYTLWRANIFSRDRALLMLFLFSDVGEHDAPTRIKIGSHRDIARILEPAGEAGMNNGMIRRFIKAMDQPEALAVGDAGTVYLCHPFLVHGAQKHRGSNPRFMAQASLPPVEPFRLDREDGSYSPVEIAIREALQGR